MFGDFLSDVKIFLCDIILREGLLSILASSSSSTVIVSMTACSDVSSSCSFSSFSCSAFSSFALDFLCPSITLFKANSAFRAFSIISSLPLPSSGSSLSIICCCSASVNEPVSFFIFLRSSATIASSGSCDCVSWCIDVEQLLNKPTTDFLGIAWYFGLLDFVSFARSFLMASSDGESLSPDGSGSKSIADGTKSAVEGNVESDSNS
mmetsp:Transcript_21191/g.23670  ORF Transcript_21191/g.23670 Transcript_21191/m.23670 type:complete len:207 (+) Transcript_21191:872-1492(+)